MIFEVVNPSDAVTLEYDNPVVAGVVTLLLGNGQYGLEAEDGTTVLPIMLFAGEEGLKEWLSENGVDDLGEFMKQHGLEIAECLETAMVCTVRERRAITKAIEVSGGDIKGAQEVFNEESRSSMNNICGNAFAWAKRFREKYEEQQAEAEG